jgi:hypothetical protein
MILIGGLAASCIASYAQVAPENAVMSPAATPAQNSVAAGIKPTTKLPSDAVVIAVRGVCTDKASVAEACVTNITRGEFERMLSAMSFNSQLRNNPVALRKFAESYAQALVLANAAESSGLDKDPDVAELMKIVRVRNLADAYRRYQQEQASKLSPDEIEAYYKDNAAKFEQLEIDRIFIPKSPSRQLTQVQTDFEKKAHAIAEKTRERAAKGEEMSKLQIDAYQQLGLTPPLTTDMGAVRHGSLPPGIEQEIFSIKEGEVTRLQIDAAGYSIYKVRNRNLVGLDQAKNEIIQVLGKSKAEAALKAASSSVTTELNENFFSTVHPASR